MLIYLIKKNDSSFPFLPADDIEPWMIWGYYISPMMYGQNAIVMNEFLDKRWSAVRYLHSLIVFICKFQICIHFPYLHTQMKAQTMHFQHLSHHGNLTKFIYCSPIMTPDLMHQQLERSFSSPEVSLPKTIGSGFVLEHFLDFLFSSMCYLLQH